MIKNLRDMGVTPEHAYTLGFASIGVSIGMWMISLKGENQARADRWGIFIGQWAPTLFALGNALSRYDDEG